MDEHRHRAIRIAIIITTIGFLCFSFLEIVKRFENVWPDREITRNIQITDPVEGENTAVWSFKPKVNSIDSIWIFYRPLGKSQIDRTVHVSLRSESKPTSIVSANATLSPHDFTNGWVHVRFAPTTLDLSQQYQMEISLPETPAGEGLSLHFNSDRNPLNHVAFGDDIIAASNIEFIWLASPSPFPWTLLCAGTASIALLIGIFHSDRLKLVLISLVSSAMVLLVSLYFRDFRVNLSFGYYWPDEYITMSQSWYRFFSGLLNWDTFIQEISNWRNAQVILFPMMIGLVQWLGATPPIAYFSIVAASTTAGIVVFFTAFTQLGFKSKLAYASAAALIITNPMLIRSAASLQTDIGGILFALLSSYLIIRIQTSHGRNQLIFAGLAGLSIYCGTITRLALAPLLILPICLALWIHLSNPQRTPSTIFRNCLASIIAIALTLITWWSLELFQSIQLAKEFSQLPAFRSQFNWTRFSEVTAYSLQISVIPMIACFKTYRTDPRLAAIAGTILGLLCILAFGKIIPWYRYWAPISVLSIYFVLVYFSNFKKRSSLYLSLYTILSILLNSFLVFSLNVLKS